MAPEAVGSSPIIRPKIIHCKGPLFCRTLLLFLCKEIPIPLAAGDMATIGVELVTIDYPRFLKITDMIGSTGIVPDELQNILASFSQDHSASTE